MTNAFLSQLVHRKKTFVVIGLAVFVTAWWALRPEKLFINKQVDEPAPFAAASGAQPVLTGPIEDASHDTLGLATIYKGPGGRQYLRISGLSTSPALLRVVLQGTGSRIDLGQIQNAQEQSFDLAASVDLHQYDSVAIYSDGPRAFAIAKLQPF